MSNAIEYIHSTSWLGSKPGLGRTHELLRRVGNPDKGLRFVHIAGTNGKGSTAAMTASILTEAGYKTGLFTSPYIMRFNERMQVDGEPITDAQLEEITDFVRPHAEAMLDHPTEFELVTVIAFEFFYRCGCDVVVLEVGMGGRLDSTNVIKTPEVAVITAIGLDHTKELGDTVEKIAAEKAGIVKPGGDVVLYKQEQSVEQVIAGVCRAFGARLHLSDGERLRPVDRSLEGQTFDWDGLAGLRLPLLGAHQLQNAAVVLTVVTLLRRKGWRIGDGAIRAGLAATRWPGRFEVICRDPLFIADGGHNVQCAAAMAANLRDYLPGRRVTFVTGVLLDKDYDGMLQQLLPYAERFVTLTPHNPRAMPASHLAAYIHGHYGLEATACDSVQDGVRKALELAGEGGVICSFGSLYMTGAIRACFGHT